MIMRDCSVIARLPWYCPAAAVPAWHWVAWLGVHLPHHRHRRRGRRELNHRGSVRVHPRVAHAVWGPAGVAGPDPDPRPDGLTGRIEHGEATERATLLARGQSGGRDSRHTHHGSINTGCTAGSNGESGVACQRDGFWREFCDRVAVSNCREGCLASRAECCLLERGF
jgi:hypothetical protein